MCGGVSYASLTYFGDLLRRTAPKFGTHVRIHTLTLHKNTHPIPGGFRGLYIVKKYFTTDRTQIWQACADRYSHLKKIVLTHTTPGGFRGLYIVKTLSRRTAPEFGMHVRIDTLTLIFLLI